MVEVSVGALGDPVAAEPGGGMPVLELTGELVVAALFADLARDLHRDDDPAATLQRIVDFAVSSVPGAQHVNAERKLTPFRRSNIDPLRGLLGWFYVVLVVVGGGAVRCVRVR